MLNRDCRPSDGGRSVLLHRTANSSSDLRDSCEPSRYPASFLRQALPQRNRCPSPWRRSSLAPFHFIAAYLSCACCPVHLFPWLPRLQTRDTLVSRFAQPPTRTPQLSAAIRQQGVANKYKPLQLQNETNPPPPSTPPTPPILLFTCSTSFPSFSCQSVSTVLIQSIHQRSSPVLHRVFHHVRPSVSCLCHQIYPSLQLLIAP